jgi:steroid 5-alpha reductase family enzyme
VKYLNPLIPYLFGLVILISQSNFDKILYLNLIFQLILFLIVVCIPIYRTERMSYVDIAWPWGLVVLGIVNYIYNEGSLLMVLISTSIVSIIGLRMGIGALSLLKRGYLKNELPRYQYQRIVWEKEEKHNTHLALQIDALTQGLANATFLAIPIFVAGSSDSEALNNIEYVGLTVVIISIFLETLADSQKLNFLKQMKIAGLKNQVCNIGLWKYSRHPNYFFEWMVWNGVILFSFPSLIDSSSLSPGNKVMIGACMLFASKLMYDTLVNKTGAIPSEYYSLKKRPSYKEYIETTSQFFPRF